MLKGITFIKKQKNLVSSRGVIETVLSRVNEIVELARIYIIVYRLEPIQAIEYAIKDIEENDKEAE